MANRESLAVVDSRNQKVVSLVRVPFPDHRAAATKSVTNIAGRYSWPWCRIGQAR